MNAFRKRSSQPQRKMTQWQANQLQKKMLEQQTSYLYVSLMAIYRDECLAAMLWNFGSEKK
jgi:hypothetical protein